MDDLNDDGLVVGIGVGMVRDTATLMLGQYFKRRREQVEILLVSASGFGLAAMSFTLREIVREILWRLGLQAVTVLLASSFILGMFYRSASLYHPQRRAILHLKVTAAQHINGCFNSIIILV